MQIRVSKSILLLTMFQSAARAFIGPNLRRQARATLATRATSFVPSTTTQNVSPQFSHIISGSTSSLVEKVNASSKLYMSTTAEVASDSLVGIDFIKESVVKVLNDAFDPKEVARAAALAKLEPKKKKKKKKKKQQEDAAPVEENEEPQMSQEEKDKIADAAAEAATPFGFNDAMVTPATRLDFGDYQCNAAMSLAKNVGMSPRDCATKIVDGLRPIIGDIMEEPEIAGPGFINLRFKKEYLEKSVQGMAKDPERLAVPVVG